jgi:hypothetical protein
LFIGRELRVEAMLRALRFILVSRGRRNGFVGAVPRLALSQACEIVPCAASRSSGDRTASRTPAAVAPVAGENAESFRALKAGVSRRV